MVQVVVRAGNLVLSELTVTDVSPAQVAGTNGFTARTLNFATPTGVHQITLSFADVSAGGGQGVDSMIDDVRISLSGQLQLPVIVAQPQSQSVPTGVAASFEVVATGTAPLVYQWWFNGKAVAEGTSSTLVINNAQAVQSGNYWVVVSNSLGSVTSSNA